MKYKLLILMALLSTSASGHRLTQKSTHKSTAYSRHRLQQRASMKQKYYRREKLFEESGFETKADMGDTDNAVLSRESWGTDDPNKKPSGWVNPLSVTDDGSDDDQVLDMGFKSLDEPYRKFIMPAYRYDEEIDDSQKSLTYAEVEVGKQMELLQKKQEEEAKKAAEAEAQSKQQQQQKQPQQPAADKKEAQPNDKKQSETKQKAETDQQKEPAQKQEAKKPEEKQAPTPTPEAKPVENENKTPATQKNEGTNKQASEKTEKQKPAAASDKASPKGEKKADSKAQGVMQLNMRGETIAVTDLDDDEVLNAQQQALNQVDQEPPREDNSDQPDDAYSLSF